MAIARNRVVGTWFFCWASGDMYGAASYTVMTILQTEGSARKFLIGVGRLVQYTDRCTVMAIAPNRVFGTQPSVWNVVCCSASGDGYDTDLCMVTAIVRIRVVWTWCTAGVGR